MNEEEDSFAPGALFKRYGQEKKDANSSTKGINKNGMLNYLSDMAFSSWQCRIV